MCVCMYYVKYKQFLDGNMYVYIYIYTYIIYKI